MAIGRGSAGRCKRRPRHRAAARAGHIPGCNRSSDPVHPALLWIQIYYLVQHFKSYTGDGTVLDQFGPAETMAWSILTGRDNNGSRDPRT